VTQAMPALEQAAQLCDHMQFQALKGSIMAFLGRAHLLRGDLAQALDLAGQGLALVRATQYTAGIIEALRSLGRIALARGALAEAATHFQEGLQLCSGRYGLGRFYLDLARLAHAQGNPEAVSPHLHEALTLFSALQLSRWVEHTTQLASELGVSLTPS
jgi:hypothetical protein